MSDLKDSVCNHVTEKLGPENVSMINIMHQSCVVFNIVSLSSRVLC